MTEEKPESAADPRPGGEPWYIDKSCQDCGQKLVYYHEAKPWKYTEEEHEDEAYHFDEFWCENCNDGLRMDWPEDYKEDFWNRIEESKRQIEEGNTMSLEELEEKLDLEENSEAEDL